MDGFIVVSSVAPFILFLGVLLVVFRIRTDIKNTLYMLYAAMSGMCISVCLWAAVCIVYRYSAIDMVFGSLFVLGIYASLVFLFLFGVFSIFEASLTLRFLLEIASGKKGISKKDLVTRYGVEQIIHRRLDRMIASRDIVRSEDSYALPKAQSYFRMREHVLALFWYIFP